MVWSSMPLVTSVCVPPLLFVSIHLCSNRVRHPCVLSLSLLPLAANGDERDTRVGRCAIIRQPIHSADAIHLKGHTHHQGSQ